MKLGNVEEARSILAARHKAVASDFDAVALLSRHDQDRGDLPRAEHVLRQYLADSPGHAAAQTHLAHVLWRRGRHDEALSELRDSLRVSARRETIWGTLVNWHSQLGQHDRAVGAARDWLEALPESGVAHFHLGHQLVQVGQHEAALAHLERAAGVREMAVEAGLDLVRVALQVGERDAALRRLLQCLAECAQFMPSHAVKVHGLARELHAQREFQAVVDCCEAIRAAYADDPVWLALHASSLRELGRTAESGQLLARFSDLFRLHRDATVDPARYGHALWMLERFDAALEEMEESLRLRPESESGWRTLVRWLEKLERGDAALEAVRRWLAVVPGSGQANWHLARLLVSRGRHEEAQVCIEQALADATAGLDLGLEIARNCLAANEVERAVALSQRLVAVPERIVSRNVGAIMALARGFHAQRKYGVAEECCRSIAGLRGEDPAFLALYGNVLLSKGDITHAREVLERSVFLLPGSDRAPRLLLALSYFHDGDAELGKAYLSEAIGFQEEGRIFAELFGHAAPLIPHFGAEIDRFLAPDSPL